VLHSHFPDSTQIVDEQHNFIGKLKRKSKKIFKRPEIQLVNTALYFYAAWNSLLSVNLPAIDYLTIPLVEMIEYSH